MKKADFLKISKFQLVFLDFGENFMKIGLEMRNLDQILKISELIACLMTLFFCGILYLQSNISSTGPPS